MDSFVIYDAAHFLPIRLPSAEQLFQGNILRFLHFRGIVCENAYKILWLTSMDIYWVQKWSVIISFSINIFISMVDFDDIYFQMWVEECDSRFGKISFCLSSIGEEGLKRKFNIQWICLYSLILIHLLPLFLKLSFIKHFWTIIIMQYTAIWNKDKKGVIYVRINIK